MRRTHMYPFENMGDVKICQGKGAWELRFYYDRYVTCQSCIYSRLFPLSDAYKNKPHENLIKPKILKRIQTNEIDT